MGSARDTQERWRGPDGEYLPQRKKLHDAIINRFLSTARSVDNPQAVFMAGGSGSGKSSVLRAGSVRLPRSYVHVDSDEIKALLPEYHQMVLRGERYAARAVHEESSDIAKQLLAQATQRRMNVVVDGTGDAERGKFVGKIMAQQAAGYRTRVVMVDVPTDVAVARATERAAITGRHVPEQVIRDLHRTVAARFAEWRRSRTVRDWELWSTEGAAPKLVARRAGGRTTIYDRRAYLRTLAKARP